MTAPEAPLGLGQHRRAEYTGASPSLVHGLRMLGLSPLSCVSPVPRGTHSTTRWPARSSNGPRLILGCPGIPSFPPLARWWSTCSNWPEPTVAPHAASLVPQPVPWHMLRTNAPWLRASPRRLERREPLLELAPVFDTREARAFIPWSWRFDAPPARCRHFASLFHVEHLATHWTRGLDQQSTQRPA